MFVCNQVYLLPFQEARFLSEDAQKKRKKFKELKLTMDEEKKLQHYSKIDVSSLSECNLVEFQELYCKERLFTEINSGRFFASLEFTIDVHSKVRDWLKYYGYYLCPNKPINYAYNRWEQVSDSILESTTKFELLW